MNKKSKIIITSITIAGLFFAYYNYDYKYVPQYEIVSSKKSLYKATYRNGNVYIVKDISEVKNLEENDIIVLDQRYGDNPNMSVISSNKIYDKNIRNDIIEIIMEYEEKYPSKWDRTVESMRLEWFVHNFLYDLNYKRDHTDNVDLDNNDEEKFDKIMINKILKI